MQQGLLSDEPSERSQEHYECEVSPANDFVPAVGQKASKWSEYLEEKVTENSCDQDFTGLRQEDGEDSHMLMGGNVKQEEKSSKWSEYLGNEGLNYGNDCESSNPESFDAQGSRGKKRKRSHSKSCVDEEYTGSCNKYQSKAETESKFVTSTAYDCMEDSKNWKKEKERLPSKSSTAGIQRNSSRWSQFLVPEEEIVPSNAHEELHYDLGKQQVVSNFNKSDMLEQKPQEKLILRGEKVCQATSVPKNPFHITDDNLDTILDF